MGLRLVLARHGQTPSNVAHVLDTVLPGPGLTGRGRDQAAALGREIGAEGPVTAVYSSAARRARETAGLLAGELDVRGALGGGPSVLEGLQEVQVGDLEGRNDDEAVEAFRTMFDRWLTGEPDLARPGGESARDLVDRYRAGVATVLSRHPEGGTVVVVGHGGALRLAARDLVDGVGVPPVGEDHLDNCGRITLLSTGTTPAWELASWSRDAPGGLPSAFDATTG